MATKVLQKQADKAAAVFAVLAGTSRVRILQLLLRERRALPVGDIASLLGMSESAVSHQLRVLADAGAVAAEADGRVVRYAFLSTGRARAFRKALRAV
jgi:ArsR family transcriptional regulator